MSSTRTATASPTNGCEPFELWLTLSDGLGPAGTSRWERRDEPFELPLVAGGYLDSSVVLYLPLDGDGLDEGPLGVETTVDGAIPVEGLFADESGAMDFDPSASSRISVSTAGFEGVGVGRPFTVSMFFRADSLQDSYLYNSGAPELSYTPGLSPEGWIRFSAFVDGDALVLDCGEYFVGRWHHFVGLWDGETLACYVDGRLSASAPVSAIAVAGTNDPLASTLGGNPNPGGTYSYDGRMDEFLIFNRAMSPAEIRAYVQSRLPWGSETLPGAQPDLDDVRVYEDGVAIPHELVGAAPFANRAADLDEHVVAYWPLDGTGADLVDGHEGEVTGAMVATGRFGDDGGALSFDGDDDVVSMTGDALPLAWDGSSSFTAEAWLRADPAASSHCNRAIFQERVGDEVSLSLNIDDEGSGCKLRCWSDDGSGSSCSSVNAVSDVTDGHWHHVACLHDPASDEVRLYVDGLLEGAATPACTSIELDGATANIGKGVVALYPHVAGGTGRGRHPRRRPLG